MITLNRYNLLKTLNILDNCCGYDTLNLLTSSINIRTKNNKLQLITTDTVNYAYLWFDLPENETFDVFVNMNTLINLIKSCNSEVISLSVINSGDASYVEIKAGNGIFKIPTIEKTKEFDIPDHKVELRQDCKHTLDLSVIKDMIAYNKPFLNTKAFGEPTCNYYVDDGQSYSSNGMLVCQHKYSQNIYLPPVVVYSRLANVLNALTDKTINWYICPDYYYFENDNISIYSKVMAIDYPIEKLKSISDVGNTDNSITVGVDVIKSAINRLVIFASPLQNNAITFTCNGNLTLKSLDSSAIDTIDNIACNGRFEFIADGNDMLSVLSSLKEDDIDNGRIELVYCDKDGYNHINIKTKNTVYIMGALSDE